GGGFQTRRYLLTNSRRPNRVGAWNDLPSGMVLKDMKRRWVSPPGPSARKKLTRQTAPGSRRSTPIEATGIRISHVHRWWDASTRVACSKPESDLAAFNCV